MEQQKQGRDNRQQHSTRINKRQLHDNSTDSTEMAQNCVHVELEARRVMWTLCWCRRVLSNYCFFWLNFLLCTVENSVCIRLFCLYHVSHSVIELWKLWYGFYPGAFSTTFFGGPGPDQRGWQTWPMLANFHALLETRTSWQMFSTHSGKGGWTSQFFTMPPCYHIYSYLILHLYCIIILIMFYHFITGNVRWCDWHILAPVVVSDWYSQPHIAYVRVFALNLCTFTNLNVSYTVPVLCSLCFLSYLV